MNGNKHFFRKKLLFISAGISEENIYDIGVDGGFAYVYTRIAVENLSSGYTKLRIGVDSIGEFQQYEEQLLPLTAVLYWTSDALYIFADQRLQIRIYGATLGDRIEVVCQGYVIFLGGSDA